MLASPIRCSSDLKMACAEDLYDGGDTEDDGGVGEGEGTGEVGKEGAANAAEKASAGSYS